MTRNKKGRFTSFKAWLKKAVAVVGVIIIGSAMGTAYFSTSTVHATVPDTIVVEAKAPIMDRIADCESGNGTKGSGAQFKANGDLVVHVNANGLWVDVGMYQINQSPAHMQLEAKLGFNVLTLEGNTAMAHYIYANEGTGPWASSAHCWNK